MMSGDPYYDDGSPDRSGQNRHARSSRQGRARRFAILASSLLTLLLVGVGLIGGGYIYFKAQYEGEGPLAQERTFIVSQGMGLTEIAGELERQGFISDSRLFMAGALIDGTGDKLKAGEYRLSARVSMAEIMEALVAGRSVQHKLTIPEGLTSEQIVQRVRDHPVLVGEVTEIPAEGSLLPDTYVFLRGMTRQKLIDRMRNAQEKVLAELWPNRDDDLPLNSPSEAVILASIVEKETSKADERAHVAAVFVNRLKQKMRLQSDPTIIYGIAGGKGSLDRPIAKADIASKTPYNTYQISGLPPTPISNPGVDAIKAVLSPAESDDLYFVADGTGGHAFAENLAGHNRNVALWRRIEAERRRLALAEAAAAEAAAAAAKAAEAAEAAAAAAAAAEAAKDSSAAAGTADDRTAAINEMEQRPDTPDVAEPPPPPPPPPPADPLSNEAAVPQPELPRAAPKSASEASVSAPVADVEPENRSDSGATPADGSASVSVGEVGMNWRGIVVPKPRPRPDTAAFAGEEAAGQTLEAQQISDPVITQETTVKPVVPVRRRATGDRLFQIRDGFK